MKLGKVLPLFEMTTFSVNQHRLSKFVQSIFSFQECLVAIGTDLPPLFATWTFYEHDMQYTPITKGSEAVFDCSAYYKIKLDDAFMDYLAGSSFQVVISDFFQLVPNFWKNQNLNSVGQKVGPEQTAVGRYGCSLNLEINV